MTDTKYVPLTKAIHIATSTRTPYAAIEELRAAAVALRVAGPDDAIVPLDALRVARRELQWALNDLRRHHESGIAEFDALAALDAAIAAATPPEQTP